MKRANSEPSNASAQKNYLLGLDLVRFVAAFFVMLFHLGFWSWWEAPTGIGTIHQLFPELPEYWALTSFTWFGWVGVQIFFVISGFVIANSAAGRTWKSFSVARFLRIFPTAWICALAILPVYLVYSSSNAAEVILRFINTIAISPIPFWLDGVFWTLVVEIVFYTIMAIAIAAGGRYIMSKLAWILTISSGLFLSLNALGIAGFSWPTTLLLLRHGVLFSLGMTLSMLAAGKGEYRKSDVILLLLSFLFSLLEIWLSTNEKLRSFSFEASALQPMCVWSVCVLIIFFTARFSSSINIVLGKYSRKIRVLGLMTYPLYLTHSLIGGVILSAVANVGVNMYVSLSIAAIGSLVVSWVITEIEPKFRWMVAAMFFSGFRKNRSGGVS